MFNHICNYIDIQLVSNVKSISKTEVILNDGISFDRIVSEKTPKWKENPKRSDSGTIYNQSFQIVSEKLSPTQRTKYPVNIPVVAILYDDDGSHIMGSFDQLARIAIIPAPETDSIQIAANSTTPIY